MINFFNRCKKGERKKVNTSYTSYQMNKFIELCQNNKNFFYDINNFKDDIFWENSNTNVSTFTQTNIILSDDDEEDLWNIHKL